MNQLSNPVRPDEYAYYLPLERGDGKPVKRMFELGNKINGDKGSYKDFFVKMGFEHISVDWNGHDGALPLDLREPIYDRFEPFDIVTNIGTTEHVSNQFGVWKNIHYLCDLHGVIVSVTPYPDGNSWWWHGEWYPTEMFFERFAELNGYRIERMGRDLPPPNENLYVRLVKIDTCEFQMPSPDTFYRNQMRPR